MDTEEEAGWIEFFRIEAEELEAEKKKHEAKLKTKPGR